MINQPVNLVVMVLLVTLLVIASVNAAEPAAPEQDNQAPPGNGIRRCQSDDQCTAEEYCFLQEPRRCVHKRPDGVSCTQPNQCISNTCTNGKCGAGEDGEGGIVDAAVEIFQEAIARIRSAILPDAGIDLEQFLSSPLTKKARAVAIVKSGDKLILARRENSALDRSAISIIRYQRVDIDVCAKINQNLPAEDRELVNCRKDPDTGSNFVKTSTSNTQLWHQLVTQVQLR